MNSALLSRVKSWFQNSRGSALAIALISVSIISLAAIGVGNLVLSSNEKTDIAKKSKESLFAVDGMFETAMYDLSGHSNGYTVENGFTNYNDLQFGISGLSSWVVSDRAITVDEDETDNYDGSVYSGYGNGDYMAYPSPGYGTTPSDTYWNRVSPGDTEEIQLFVDNTSCSQEEQECF